MPVLNKIKSNISENNRLNIIIYDMGFVSLFIVLLKLNKRVVSKRDEIIGRPGINQAKFNNIASTRLNIKRNYTFFHLFFHFLYK